MLRLGGSDAVVLFVVSGPARTWKSEQHVRQVRQTSRRSRHTAGWPGSRHSTQRSQGHRAAVDGEMSALG